MLWPLNNFKCKMTASRTLPRVLAKLEELGYKMEYNREEWTKYNFAMSWDCGVRST